MFRTRVSKSIACVDDDAGGGKERSAGQTLRLVDDSVGQGSSGVSFAFTHQFLYCILLALQALARKLAPLGDRILVRRAPKEVQTASGIYLPADKTKDPNEGEVVAAGPGERDVTGNLHATTLKVGDKVTVASKAFNPIIRKIS